MLGGIIIVSASIKQDKLHHALVENSAISNIKAVLIITPVISLFSSSYENANHSLLKRAYSRIGPRMREKEAEAEGKRQADINASNRRPCKLFLYK